MNFFNILLPNGTICSRIAKISYLKKEGIIEKKIQERFTYESVDNESLSYRIYLKIWRETGFRRQCVNFHSK